MVVAIRYVMLIFISRPLLPIAMNEGQLRPAWFDAFHLPPCGSCGVSGIGASVARIEHIILAEMQILSPPNRVVVAGFSQGAALSMILALTSLHDLGGVASLSGWIPRRCRQVCFSRSCCAQLVIASTSKWLNSSRTFPYFGDMGLLTKKSPL